MHGLWTVARVLLKAHRPDESHAVSARCGIVSIVPVGAIAVPPPSSNKQLHNVLDRVYNLSMTTKTRLPNWYAGPTLADGTHAQYDLNAPGGRTAWEAAWAERMNVAAPEPIADETRGHGTEQQESDPARSKRLAEATAYIASYTGTWGLILDLKADRKFGTKWFRLSDRQIEVILNAKDRDAARTTEITPEQTALVAKVIQTLIDVPARRPEFIISIVTQAATRPLSEKQTACLVRFLGESVQSIVEGAKPRTEVAEGWYMVGETPWKVQHNREHTGLYAKRLDVIDGSGSWEYVQGGLRVIATKGTPMTVEQAAEFGKLYSVCAVCGRELTLEESIERGVGPVCAGRLG